MEDQINRNKGEELRALYRLKQATGKPLAVLLNEAIRELAANYGAPILLGAEPALRNVDQETWEDICEYRHFLDQLDYQKCLIKLERIKNGNKK